MHFFILFIIIIQVNGDLYKKFTNELDKISNYAEQQIERKTVQPLNKIYENTNQLLFRKLRKIPETDKLNNKTVSIEKLRNVLLSHERFNGMKKIYPKSLKVITPLTYQFYRSNFVPTSLLNNDKKENQSDIKMKNQISNNDAILKYDASNALIRYKRYDDIGQKLDNAKKFQNDHDNNMNDENILSSLKNQEDKLQKRFDTNWIDPKSVMNTIPSLYPNVITNTNGLSLDSLSKSYNDIKLPSMDQIKDFQNILLSQQQSQFTNTSPSIGSQSISTNIGDPSAIRPKNEVTGRNSSDCEDFLNPNNLTVILEKVLQELEYIKQSKIGNFTPDGTPCGLIGSWNSDIIGLRFDISISGAMRNLNVGLRDRYPKKRSTLMDLDWICTGGTVNIMGGPFYITAQKKPENILATFTGLCKRCGSLDMIFGSWTFVKPAKDCQDITMTIENKRDVFRRERFEEKKKEMLQLIKSKLI